ncbi:MAG: hypothetical protein FD138_2075 [Planctomycetota bacterium]|nr:MAG: hypothetical protein FD138_2075 [Planctomycetota bacterium]
MTSPNIGVYQCPGCGSVVEQELRRLPPFCCGWEMSKASERLARHDELSVPDCVAQRWIKIVGHDATEVDPPLRAQFQLHGL